LFCYVYFVLVSLLFLNLVVLFLFYGLLDMGRFIIRKRRLDNDSESSVAGTSFGSITLYGVFIASWVGLSPLYCGHFWPIVPAPDDR
jgi:hypothetical protein